MPEVTANHAGKRGVLVTTLATAGEHRIGVITLNAPQALNAVSLAMSRQILAQLLQWRDDPTIACVFLQGAGERAFCAGGDIRALYQSMIALPGGPCDCAETFFAVEYRQDFVIHHYPKPIIIWGNGFVMGGGLGIMAGGSHRIVTETTRAAMPEITIGLFPDVGAGHFLNRMPGRCGLFVGLTGAILNAADCLYANWANFFLAQAQRQDLLDALCAHQWSATVATNYQRVDAILNQLVRTNPVVLPRDQLANVQPIVDALCSGDDARAVVNTIIDFESFERWLCDARDNLRYGSPLAALLIWRHLTDTKVASLKEVLQQDLVLATNGVRGKEFAEGVRALLIDKDRTPRWQFASVDQVPDAVVDSYFSSPWVTNPLVDL